VKWLRDNAGHIVQDLSKRTDRAMDYALNNDEFKNALASILASKLGIPHHLIPAKQAEIVSAIAHLSLDFHDFSRGNRFEASMHIVNTVSSTTLALLVPYGGTMADALNIAGAFSTAYVYGYFFAP
jgi:hypothetical protein